MSLLLVIMVLAFIFSAVRPGEHASSVHLVALPIAFVDSLVRPLVLSAAVDVVVDKIAFVGRFVSPEELSVAIFLALLVGPLVLGAIWPLLIAFTMLLVVLPVA